MADLLMNQFGIQEMGAGHHYINKFRSDVRQVHIIDLIAEKN